MKELLIFSLFFSVVFGMLSQNRAVKVFQLAGSDYFTIEVINEDTKYIVTGGSKTENRMAFGIDSEEHCLSSPFNGNKKYVYLDTTGVWIIPPVYAKAEDFYDGLAVVSVCVPEGGYNQYHILPDGSRLYKQKYVDVSKFVNGYSIVDKDGGYHMCHIDKTGKPLYPQTYQSLDNFSESGRAIAVRNINTSADKCLWVVIDIHGEELCSVAEKYYNQEVPELIMICSKN